MSNTTDIIRSIEDFVYTPYGVATVAAVAILITSFVWLTGCCIYCCMRWRCRLEESGVAEANKDIQYLGIHGNERGTLSSGYNTSYSLNSITTDHVINTSLDCIIHHENWKFLGPQCVVLWSWNLLCLQSLVLCVICRAYTTFSFQLSNFCTTWWII